MTFMHRDRGLRHQRSVIAVKVPSQIVLIVSISLERALTLLYHIELTAFILPEKQGTTFPLITEV